MKNVVDINIYNPQYMQIKLQFFISCLVRQNTLLTVAFLMFRTERHCIRLRDVSVVSSVHFSLVESSLSFIVMYGKK